MDPRALAHRLESQEYKTSRRFRALLSEPPFDKGGPSTPEQVLNWCRWLADKGYGRLGLPADLGGEPSKFSTLGHELGFFDFSLMMRFGLQFAFVSRAVNRLGSDEQQNLLEKISRCERTVCLAMSEIDHGSHVKGLQTIARYETDEECFVLDTPSFGATKDYVCSLETADLALVFCRLMTPDQDHGIHAFIVSLRDDRGKVPEGIRIEAGPDIVGLSGLSFGRLSFEGARVAKKNLLSRHAYIDSEGDYHCQLKSDSHRFNAMMGTLMAGRALLASGAAAGAKTCLVKTLRYSHQRRQFSTGYDDVERTILSYQSTQRRLMPLLATVIVIDAGRSRLAAAQGEYVEDSLGDRKLEIFTSALKAYATDFAAKAASICRQSCGGIGTIQQGRLADIRCDLDLFTTMEGDNTVLNLSVARNIVTDYQRNLSSRKLMRNLTKVIKGIDLAIQSNPLKSRTSRSEDLVSPDFLSRALRYRREKLKFTLARRIADRLSKELEIEDALNDCQSHCLGLAKAYCEEKLYRYLRNLAEGCPPGWDRKVLDRVLALFALSRIEDDCGWFLEQGYLSAAQSKSIRREVLELCSSLANDSESILDSFELPQSLLGCPLIDIGRP